MKKVKAIGIIFLLLLTAVGSYFTYTYINSSSEQDEKVPFKADIPSQAWKHGIDNITGMTPHPPSFRGKPKAHSAFGFNPESMPRH